MHNSEIGDHIILRTWMFGNLTAIQKYIYSVGPNSARRIPISISISPIIIIIIITPKFLILVLADGLLQESEW